MVDDDTDPFNQVREWWNEDGKNDRIPRRHLFDALGLKDDDFSGESTTVAVGKGKVLWSRESPVKFALSPAGDEQLAALAKTAAAAAGLAWKETSYLTLRRGPYVIGAGLDEASTASPKVLTGRFVNLFDPTLAVQRAVTLAPGVRAFLLDLDTVKSNRPKLLASACKALPATIDEHLATWTVEGGRRHSGRRPDLDLQGSAFDPTGPREPRFLRVRCRRAVALRAFCQRLASARASRGILKTSRFTRDARRPASATR